MEVFLNSLFLVCASEMGDKTQLLALVLAARFRKPWVVLAGVGVATVLNHALASWAGLWLSTLLTPQALRWALAASFFVFAAWLLVPDKEPTVEAKESRFGAFLVTAIAFFFAEMGDKTQFATVALGAHYGQAFLVTIGTTIGMLLSNALAIFFGQKLLARLPLPWLRALASLLFAFFGLVILLAPAQ